MERGNCLESYYIYENNVTILINYQASSSLLVLKEQRLIAILPYYNKNHDAVGYITLPSVPCTISFIIELPKRFS